MKTILALSILFCAIALPALGELKDADLDKIRLIVKEEVKIEISEAEKRITNHVDLKISSVEKQITLLTNFVYGLIALIVLAVGIPQILMTLRSKKDQTQEKRLEELTREFETLKQQDTVSIGAKT